MTANTNDTNPGVKPYYAYYISGRGSEPWLRQAVLLHDDGSETTIEFDRASGEHDPRLPARRAGEGPIHWDVAVPVCWYPHYAYYTVGGEGKYTRFAGLAKHREGAERLAKRLNDLRSPEQRKQALAWH